MQREGEEAGCEECGGWGGEPPWAERGAQARAAGEGERKDRPPPSLLPALPPLHLPTDFIYFT